jgi:hypothetical protein
VHRFSGSHLAAGDELLTCEPEPHDGANSR